MSMRSVFHAAYLRWLLPIIALLIMATLLVLGPALFTHAAGVKGTNTGTSSQPVITTSSTPHASPSIFWDN